MKTLINCLVVGGAGFFGAIARYGVSVIMTWLLGPKDFPVATLTINVTGSALLGWFITYMGTRYAGPSHETLRLAVAVGFVGAYTTFSTYMLETDMLFRKGQFITGSVYMLGSLALGLMGIQLGMWLAR